MAMEARVVYVPTAKGLLAHYITRLTDDVEFDEIEQLLIAPQRAGACFARK
jgi:hypothetical protein